MNNDRVFLMPIALADGYQTHQGHYSYYLLYNKSNFDGPNEAEGILPIKTLHL